jgi:hypothetical protein
MHYQWHPTIASGCAVDKFGDAMKIGFVLGVTKLIA